MDVNMKSSDNQQDAPIESLRNLGPKSGQWLWAVGIHSIADLRSIGPVVAYRIIKQRQPSTSLNLLWAMAAGLEEKDWRDLAEAVKARLRKEAEIE
jgi:DNA transformation protein